MSLKNKVSEVLCSRKLIYERLTNGRLLKQASSFFQCYFRYSCAVIIRRNAQVAGINSACFWRFSSDVEDTEAINLPGKN